MINYIKNKILLVVNSIKTFCPQSDNSMVFCVIEGDDLDEFF